LKPTKHEHDLLKFPVEPFEVEAGLSVKDALEKMGRTSFQARTLATAVDIWESMLRDDATVFLGLAGALVPAGMRKLVAYLIEHRYIDCLVSTGANLFHDCVETLGEKHFRGTPTVDDAKLREARVDRIYDVFAREDDFIRVGDYIRAFASEIAADGPYSTREFLYLFGKKLGSGAKEQGILTTAAEKGVPIYCPGLSDSSIGIELAVASIKGADIPMIDIIKDVAETARIVEKSRKTGVIYLGGGVPKNFIQQTQVTLTPMEIEPDGHDYAVQVITDPPHWGGLSGCTLEEAQSWGKVARDAKKVTVYCDVTIALPLLVSSLVDRCGDIAGRERMSFSTGPVLEMKVAE
jgi:deoxyhypusine synthase